ncbi:uncharacterized protein LOC122852137 isoform X1 [Aphidius gifuensis]|uniref:uncharacterized protein LOC122852137 isoform X1 n=1 Tax=Aphidius gifuensis TaxID=684658 RepID=UPI001CDBE254|nr:uncharacterized protein LOC122852137 isoform X1 [Aphidius gifuensis]
MSMKDIQIHLNYLLILLNYQETTNYQLLIELNLEENVFLLLDTILAEPQTESSIVRRIQVLLVLLGQETTSQQTCDMQECSLGLHVARLFTALLSNENFNVYKKLQQFNTLKMLLDF